MASQDIDVEIKGIATTIAKLEAYERVVTDERVPGAMGDIGAEIQMDTQRNITSNGQVDTGNMRASVGYEVTGSGSQTVTEVGSNVVYTPFQEAINPFLAPAVESNLPYAESRLKDAVDVGGL